MRRLATGILLLGLGAASATAMASESPPQHVFQVPLPWSNARGSWEAGSRVSFSQGAFPPFHGDVASTQREEWRVIAMDASLGVGSGGRVRVRGGWQRFEEEGGLAASGIDDLRLSFGWELPRWLPVDLGLTFEAKLPNAPAARRLGTDQTDLFMATTVGRSLDLWGWAAGAGLGILGHPARPGSQDDLLWLGGSGWIRLGPPRRDAWMLGEITGATTSRFFNDVRLARAGLVLKTGAGWGLQVMARRGLTSVSEAWGAELGFTWPF